MSPDSIARICAFWAFVEAGQEVDRGAEPTLPAILDDTIVLHYSANGASAVVHAGDMRAMVKHLESLNDPAASHAAVTQGRLVPIVSNTVKWRYDKAPIGAKLFLLTHGGVAVVGNWRDDGDFIGWHPLFDRDSEQEARLFGAKNETRDYRDTSAGASGNPGPSTEYLGTATDPAMGADPDGQPTDF